MEQMEARSIWPHWGWDDQEAREYIGAHLNELHRFDLDRIAGIIQEATRILPMHVDDVYPNTAKE